MGFAPKWTDNARTQYDTLKAAALQARAGRVNARKASDQEGLFKQVSKCLQLLLDNPRHPGLHTHEYHSLPHPYNNKEKVFEAYAQNHTPDAYRVFWCYGPERRQITIIAITPHP